MTSSAPAATIAPVSASSSATDRCSRSGRSSLIATRAASRKQHQHQLEVDQCPAQGRVADQRHHPDHIDDRLLRKLGGGHHHVERGSQQARHDGDDERDRDRAGARTPTRLAPGGRSACGRQTAPRRSSPPGTPATGPPPAAVWRPTLRAKGSRTAEPPRDRPDGECERAAHRVAVGGDRAPVHQVPALGQVARR